MLDTFIVGQVSEDINVDYDGKTIRELGGAVVYSGFVAGNLGHKVGVLPKSNNPIQIEELFAKAGNVKVFPAQSRLVIIRQIRKKEHLLRYPESNLTKFLICRMLTQK